jgi:hypothetical protein
MRSVAALALTLLALGCSREAPRDAAPTSIPLESVRPDWKADRALADRKGASGLEGRDLAARTRHGVRAAEPAVQAEPIVQPPPYAYVGKVARGQTGYAVLTRGDQVFLVGAGDTLERYRVLSVSEKEVLVLSIDSATRHSIAFSAASGSSAVLPAGAAGGIDEVSLQLSAPSQVAVGEQFTLTVSLDSGMSVVLDTGRLEVRYDPKVLEILGRSAASGAARIDITGAYAGHPAPATLQFRVIASSPTATEIRVIPTSISDSDGRDVGVNTPQAHRLSIVRAAAAGG